MNCADFAIGRSSRRGALGMIWSTISWLVVVSVALLAVVLVGIRAFGYTPFAVLTGSMTPTYRVGDLIYVHEKTPEDIQVGEAITFVANSDLLIVTHRVVDVDREACCFTTKGDANNAPDANPVPYENVVGTVRFSIPRLGYVSDLLSGQRGRYICFAALALLAVMLILPEVLRSSPEEKEQLPEAKPNFKEIPVYFAEPSDYEEHLVDDSGEDFPIEAFAYRSAAAKKRQGAHAPRHVR